MAFGWVKGHWPLILGILLGPVALAAALIYMHWRQITAGAARMFHDVVSFFTSLPGRILGALGDLGSLLFGAGKRVVQGLFNGIKSMIGGVGGAIGGVVDEIKSFLPFSPAKKGPLSGSGAPERSGASIARLLARGITGGRGGVTSAMDQLTRSAGLSGRSLGPAGGAYAGGGRLDVYLHFQPTGSKVMDAFVDGLKVEVRSRGGGGPHSVQKALGRTWPAGG